MKALVTGGAGFIGSHLVEHLLKLGHQVVVIDDLSSGDLDNLAESLQHPAFQFLEGSILDSILLDEVMCQCDTVFHLAAAVGVQMIVDHPLPSLRTNLHGTERVLEQAVRHQCRVLITSTSEVYGKNDADKLHEDDDRVLGSPLKSRWSYAAAKALDELLAYTYWREQGLPAVIVRLFNVVGPRQTGRYGMVIPRFVDQALRGEPITIYGDGTQTRCFCYVGDVVPTLVTLVEHPEAYGRVFNLGGSVETSIEELAKRVLGVVGSDSPIAYVPYALAYGEGYEDMRRRVPDTTALREFVGFAPTIDLDRIIDLIVASRLNGARL